MLRENNEAAYHPDLINTAVDVDKPQKSDCSFDSKDGILFQKLRGCRDT